MRLSLRLQKKIKSSIRLSFGDVAVYLFGSRTDDSKRGGDIDLAVDVELSKDEFRSNKIQFIRNMLQLGLDLKIDLVQLSTTDSLLHDELEKSKVLL